MNGIELFPSKADVEKVDSLWAGFKGDERVVIAVAPGSKWFTKMWPADYYSELLDMLARHSEVQTLVIGSDEDRRLRVEIPPCAVDLRGQTKLLEVAELLRRCDVLVSNDSSPIHIASAFSCHIVAIFGPTTRDLGFFPWSPSSTVLEVEGMNCRPCGLHGGNRCPQGHFRCMRDISPAEVYKAVERVIKSRLTETD